MPARHAASPTPRLRRSAGVHVAVTVTGWLTVLVLGVVTLTGMDPAQTAATAESADPPASPAAANGQPRSELDHRASRSGAAGSRTTAAVAPQQLAAAADAPGTPPAAAPPPAPPARAGSCVDADPQTRGERVLASLPAAWQSSGYPVRFSGPRKGYYGEVRHEEPIVEVYVRRCAQESDDLLRHVLAHELGHARDLTAMDDQSRAAYRAARGIPAGTPWFGCSGCSDFETPAGDFAETYAQWLTGSASNSSRLARPATQAELADLAARFFA